MNNLVSVLLIISSVTTLIMFLLASEKLSNYTKSGKAVLLFISFMWLFSDEIFTDEAKPHLKKERKTVITLILVTLCLYLIGRVI